MRRFWVKNAKGQVFDMNREDAFFSAPKGLGIARKTTYINVGHSWMEKESILNQKKPYGNMVFDNYEQYDEFIRVIQYTPLVLMYQPLEEMYYMDVNTFTIDKGDINIKDTFLTCKVTFEGCTPWYLAKKIARKESDLEGKRYVYTYPYSYIDNAIGEAEIINDSGMSAYCRIKIYGPVVNPVWRLEQGGREVAGGKLLCEIPADSCLIIDSDPRVIGIAEYDLMEQFITDRYEDSDFDTERFIYPPPGTSILRVSHAGISPIKFIAEVMVFAG